MYGNKMIYELNEDDYFINIDDKKDLKLAKLTEKIIKKMLDIKKINLYGLSIPFKKIETNWSKRSGTTSILIEIKTSNNISGYGEMIAFFQLNSVR